MVKSHGNKLEQEVVAGRGQLLRPIRRRKKNRPGLRERLRQKRIAAKAELESEVVEFVAEAICIDISDEDESAPMDSVAATDKPGTSYGGEDPAKKEGDPTYDDLRHKLNQITITESNAQKVSTNREVVLVEQEDEVAIDWDLWQRATKEAVVLTNEVHDSDSDGIESNNGVWTL